MIPKWKGKINDKLNLIEIKKENEKAGHRLGENIDKCVFDKKKKKKNLFPTCTEMIATQY